MLSKLKDQARPIITRLVKFQYLIVGTVIVAVFAYTINIINSELSPARNEAAYEEARLKIERVEFDENSVKTIVRLRDLNIDVSSIFAPGRTNPFE